MMHDNYDRSALPLATEGTQEMTASLKNQPFCDTLQQSSIPAISEQYSRYKQSRKLVLILLLQRFPTLFINING